VYIFKRLVYNLTIFWRIDYMYVEYSEKSQVWFVYDSCDWVVASFEDRAAAEAFVEEQA
jgi:hypothetical protein